MGAIRTSAGQAFRPFATDGVPSSGVHEPVKSDIVETFGLVEDRIEAVERSAVGGLIAYATWAELAAHATAGLTAGATGKVYGDAGTHTDPVTDATVDNEGIYSWVDPDGWQRIADLDAEAASEAAALAEKWAAEEPDVEVAEGMFSARHYAGEAEASATEAASDAVAAKSLAAQRSLWPDPWFELTGGDAAATDAGHAIYAQGSSYNNRTWDPDFVHAWGKGAWVFAEASAAFQGFDLWFDMAGAAEVGIAEGDEISAHAIVRSDDTGTVSLSARFFSAVSSAGVYTFVGGQVNGSAGVAMDGTEKVLKIENLTVPSGAVGVVVYLFDGASADACGFGIVAFGAVKGATAGDRPPLRLTAAQRASYLAGDIETVAGERLAKADWATSEAPYWDPESETPDVDLTSESVTARTNNYSGFGDIVTPPTTAVNAIRLPTLQQATGGAAGGVEAVRPWSTLKVYARTGAAGAADDAGAQVLAVGTLEVDPSETLLTDVWVPLRDPETGAFVTIQPEDWGAEAAIGYQVYDANGDPASVNQSNGTRPDRVSPARSYYFSGTKNGQTGSWSALSGNPGIAIQMGLLTGVVDRYVPSRELQERLGGDPAALAERVDRSLDAAGFLKQPAWGDWRFRRVRSKFRLALMGSAVPIDLAVPGDSWSDWTPRWVAAFTDAAVEKYGDGGPGWIGFGFTGAGVITGNARPLVYSVAKSGTWASDYHNGAAHSPNASNAVSSEVGAKFTVTAQPAATAVLTSMKLMWMGTADGVVSYSWNGGDPVEMNVQGSGVQTAELADLPATAAWTLEIAVVSGEVELFGLVGGAASGFRLHKLSSSGGKASDFADLDATAWQTGLAALAPDAVMPFFGTNERAQGQTPEAFAEALQTLWTRSRAAAPGCDLACVVAPENPTSETYPMADYAAAAVLQAEAADAAFLNLQLRFGLDPSEYEDGSDRPMLANDDVHPVNADDDPAILDAIWRFVGA